MMSLPATTEFGTDVETWSQQIIWGTRVLTGPNLIYVEQHRLGQDSIVWGSVERRQHRVGHARTDGDNIVWGTTADGDNIVWGTAHADDDNIVWGTAADDDNIVWGTLLTTTTSCGARRR